MKHAISRNNPPEVWVGDRSRHAGKISVKMCGGTAYPKDVYEKLSQAGVGTVICMHVPENHLEEARKNHINIIISGHMASDSLGINLFADKVEQKGVEITPCSGFIRVKRSGN
jgi:putative NIF3 family GTP cyclohydrolase 1 type 2